MKISLIFIKETMNKVALFNQIGSFIDKSKTKEGHATWENNSGRDVSTFVGPGENDKQKFSLTFKAGAKFETKQPLLEKLLGTYPEILLGGALATDLLKARGMPVGASLTWEEVPA